MKALLGHVLKYTIFIHTKIVPNKCEVWLYANLICKMDISMQVAKIIYVMLNFMYNLPH